MFRPASPKVPGTVLATKAQVLNSVPGTHGAAFGFPTTSGRAQLKTAPPQSEFAIFTRSSVGVNQLPGLCGNNSGHPPIADDLIGDAGNIWGEALALPEGQLINKIEDEPVANVEIGVAILQVGRGLQPEVSLILRAEAGAGSVVQRVAVCVGRLKLQPA